MRLRPWSKNGSRHACGTVASRSKKTCMTGFALRVTAIVHGYSSLPASLHFKPPRLGKTVAATQHSPQIFFQHTVLGSRWILVFSFCEARLETHQRDFSGACGSVAVGSATICKVPQLRRHIRFCKRARAVRANSLSARRTTNWGLTGEQHDTNLTNWGKQPQSSAFNTSLELLMLAWLGEGCVDGW